MLCIVSPGVRAPSG